MPTLITGATVYTPEPIEASDVLVAGDKIIAVEKAPGLSGQLLEVVDAGGRLLLPGLIDALTHPCGGGGEGGYGNRTPEMTAQQFIQSGVTCPVGALGTDSITRSLEVLFGSTMQLRQLGIDAHMYTGAYRVPAPTLTGDIAKDIALVEPVIGVGEVAIADHRSSQPSVQELTRIAADARLGGVLSGKGGTVLVHVGDGEQRLTLLRRALQDSELPAQSFYPTHINRSTALLQEAGALASAGAFVDITVCTTPELIAAGDIPALEAISMVLQAGAPATQVTLSSDAGGSLPLYVDGELRGLTAALPDCLPALLLQAIEESPELFPTVVAGLTLNPARALGLNHKGRIEVGADADLLLLDPDSGGITDVMCRGRWLLRDGNILG